MSYNIEYKLPQNLDTIKLDTAKNNIGSEEIIAKTLISFAHRYKNAIETCKAYIDSDKLDNLQVYIHTIKGLSAIMGMTALNEQAIYIDSYLKAKHIISIRVFDAFFNAIDCVLQEICNNVSYAVICNQGSIESEEKVYSAFDLLTEIEERLQSNRYIKSDILNECIGQLCGIIDESEIHKFADAIEDVQYENALTHISKFKKLLHDKLNTIYKRT